MVLTEIKNKSRHYFRDEQDRLQGEYKAWYLNGQQYVICHYRYGELHGEYKDWHPNGHRWEISHYRDGKLHGEFKGWSEAGKLNTHTFDVNGEEIINFLENPELYPETPEEKTMFVLKYNIGDAPFIREREYE